ncbi:unnamed protein product, partial [Laminaria digitata]
YLTCWRVSTAPDICGFGAGGEADDPDYTVSAYAASKISESDAEILKYAPSLEELNKEVGKVRYQIEQVQAASSVGSGDASEKETELTRYLDRLIEQKTALIGMLNICAKRKLEFERLYQPA